MDAALGRNSHRFQQPWGRALRAPLRAPGSAMGTSASSITTLASCSRVAGQVGATMVAGCLLLVSARKGPWGGGCVRAYVRERGGSSGPECRRRAVEAARLEGLLTRQ